MKKKPIKSNRCEGWRRRGCVLTFGPVEWEQCKETGTVMLKFKDGGEIKTLPACPTCWKECIANEIKIIESKPI